MILRQHRPRRYTCIDNVILERDDLSFRDKGLLAYLLSRPDGWEAKSSHLATVGPDGRDAVLSSLAALEEAGFIRRRKERGPTGQFRTVTDVTDVTNAWEPTESGEPDSGPDQALPDVTAGQTENGSADSGQARPLATKESATTEKATNTPVRVSSSPNGKAGSEEHSDDVETQFEKFWNHYPKKRSPKGSKQKARAAFRKLTLEQRRAAYKWVEFMDAETARLGRSNPHVATYLNQQRWEEYEERDDGETVEVPGELWNAGGRGVFVG